VCVCVFSPSPSLSFGITLAGPSGKLLIGWIVAEVIEAGRMSGHARAWTRHCFLSLLGGGGEGGERWEEGKAKVLFH